MQFISRFFQRFSRAPRRVPPGHYLLRYYKAHHRGRVDQAVTRAQIQDAIRIIDGGDAAAGKIAVYCKSCTPEAESLFFQHYTLAKQEEHRFATTHAHAS